MQKPKLYRGPGNNGVQVLVAPAAFEVLKRFTQTRTWTDAEERTMAAGTMTFVSPDRYLTSDQRRLHYGTYEMLDVLGGIFEIVRAENVLIDVPFCQGNPELDKHHLSMGYGYASGNNAAAFDLLVANAKVVAGENALLETMNLAGQHIPPLT